MINFYSEVIPMNSPLLEKSLDFATQIVLFYEVFSKSKKDTTIAKQLLRSATTVYTDDMDFITDFVGNLQVLPRTP